MAQKIQIRRGLKAELPTLDIAEFALCTDTNELYVGSAIGNILIAKESDIVAGSKTSVTASNTNGYIVVDGTQIKVYDDTTLNNTLSNLQLSNIKNVDITGQANGYVLTYNSTTNKYEAKPASGGSGGVLIYNTVSDLQVAYPSGTNQPVWITSEDAWYYWSNVTNTAPSITSSFNTTSANDVTSISIPYSITDAEGGSLTATYTKDGTAITSTVATGSNTWSVGTLAVGSHSLSIQVTDSGSLTSNTLTFNITVTASNTAPSISSSYNTTSVYTTNSVSIPYTVTDAEGGTLTATYTIDGTSTTSSVSTGVNTWNAGTLAAGSHTLTIQVKDSGNLTSNTLSFTITASVPADTTPPNPVTSLAATTGSITSTSIPITWVAGGSNDVANYEVAYMPSGGSWTVASNVVNASSTSFTVTGLTPSTSYTIRVVAIDTSGNRSTDSTVVASTVAAPDTTAPTVTVSPVAGTYTSSQSVTLTGTDDSGVTPTIYYTTDNSTPTYPASGTTQTYSAAISISATTTLKYIAVDGSGNVSTVQTQIYTISAPTNGNAVLMNGTSDYISTPSINFDTVEITLDLLNSNAVQQIFYGDTQNSATINTISNNVNQRYVNGNAVSSLTSPPLNINQKYTLKFDLKVAVTEAVTLLAGSGGGNNWLNGIFYGATFYLAGAIVAKYDVSTGGLTDQSGNGKDATLHGGTWKTNPMYINASASPAPVSGGTWNAANIPTFTLTTNIANSIIYYEWSTSSNDTNLTTSSSVYSSPTQFPVSGGTRYLRYFGVNNNTGEQTSITTITVVVDNTAPANVTGLTATPAQTSVALSWTASGTSDLASYNVYNGSTFVANVLKGTNTYTVTGLTASTTYTFKITSVDAVGNESSGSTVTTTTTA